MQTSTELREQAILFTEAASRETSRHAKHMLSLHAAALAKRAAETQREEDVRLVAGMKPTG
jgi:hypothetical protein